MRERKTYTRGCGCDDIYTNDKRSLQKKQPVTDKQISYLTCVCVYEIHYWRCYSKETVVYD